MSREKLTFDLVALDEENRKLATDFDLQRELFAKFGYPNPGPYLMGHNVILKTPEGGYKMTTRENPVDFMFDNDGHARCVAGAQKTYAERVGGLKHETLKNPETMKRVMDNLMCQSVEVGEVAAWAEI